MLGVYIMLNIKPNRDILTEVTDFKKLKGSRIELILLTRGPVHELVYGWGSLAWPAIRATGADQDWPARGSDCGRLAVGVY